MHRAVFLRSSALAVTGRRPGAAAAVLRLSRSNQQAAAASNMFDQLDGERRRLLYRSKQRGWLEMDIMLGNWAEANLKRLDKSELDQYAALLAMENPDLYKWLTGQEAIPDNVQNDLLRQLCSELKESVAPKVTVTSTASFEGKVWE